MMQAASLIILPVGLCEGVLEKRSPFRRLLVLFTNLLTTSFCTCLPSAAPQPMQPLATALVHMPVISYMPKCLLH